MQRNQKIRHCLESKGWLPTTGCEQAELRFLAQGEYNENWLLTCGNDQRVVRINHGSQLGLQRQIEYEYHVLQAVADSGVTPRPFSVDADACGLGQGLLMMEYLPGHPLNYERDADKAAKIFARVHSRPVRSSVDENGFVKQPEPVRDIAEESEGLVRRYLHGHSMQDKGQRLLRYHAEIMDLYDRTREEFLQEPQVIVNTEVNSGNFIVDGDGAWLVDWEKAVVSSRHQDLGHFLVPTTTLWKTDYRFSRQARLLFLRAYAAEWEAVTGTLLDMDALDRRTGIMERTILLRGLSWCFMAFHEYTASDRGLRNADTFATIKRYLEELECFLAPTQ